MQERRLVYSHQNASTSLAISERALPIASTVSVFSAISHGTISTPPEALITHAPRFRGGKEPSP